MWLYIVLDVIRLKSTDLWPVYGAIFFMLGKECVCVWECVVWFWLMCCNKCVCVRACARRWAWVYLSRNGMYAWKQFSKSYQTKWLDNVSLFWLILSISFGLCLLFTNECLTTLKKHNVLKFCLGALVSFFCFVGNMVFCKKTNWLSCQSNV